MELETSCPRTCRDRVGKAACCPNCSKFLIRLPAFHLTLPTGPSLSLPLKSDRSPYAHPTQFQLTKKGLIPQHRKSGIFPGATGPPYARLPSTSLRHSLTARFRTQKIT